MALTRRGALTAGLAAGATSGALMAAAGPLPAPAFRVAAPGAGTRDYTAALEALRAYALSELTQIGLPGMTICVTDADGFTAVVPLGWADVEQRIPLSADASFQIGSISKSFIALTCLALADQGKLDLDAPLRRYLPDAALPDEPITVLQVLGHVSGLPDGAPTFPRVPGGRLWCGFIPGARFSYSNTGYELLGRAIERVTGRTHWAAVGALVRDKLGLSGMAATLNEANRSRFAVGYWPWDRTAPALPGARLESAYFTEEDTPAGCIGASAPQMAIYLRALMRIAAGHGGPLFSDAAAARFVAPIAQKAPAFGPGAKYAMGVGLQPVDGAMCLHHTGGMMSFASSFHADPAAGVGAFASVNCMFDDELYRPRQVTRYAVELMRAVKAGASPPPPPDPLAPWRPKTAAGLLGAYSGAAGTFTLATGSDGQSLLMFGDGVNGEVVPRGDNSLTAAYRDPGRGNIVLDIERKDGAVVGLWRGGDYFQRPATPAAPAPAPALASYAGAYLNRDPWVGSAEVAVRGDHLALVGQGRLVDRGGWWSLTDDPGGIERLRFDGVLDGRAMRLNVSGHDLERLTV